MRQRAIFLATVGALVAGCGDGGGPGLPPRTYLMGFSAIPPRFDSTTAPTDHPDQQRIHADLRPIRNSWVLISTARGLAWRVNRNAASTYLHADLTEQIIGAFFDVYNELRPGLREIVYERAMVLALQDREIAVAQQEGTTVRFRNQAVGTFRADLIVERTVLVELKARPTIEREHIAQTLNALRATGLQVGLILNFGPRAQIKRLIATDRPDQQLHRSR